MGPGAAGSRWLSEISYLQVSDSGIKRVDLWQEQNESNLLCQEIIPIAAACVAAGC